MSNGNKSLRVKSDSLTAANADIAWIKRFLDGNKLNIPDPYNPGSGKTSTHGLSYHPLNDKEAIIFPEIIQQGDSLVRLGNDAAREYAIKNNTAIKAPIDLAEFYSKEGLIQHRRGGKMLINSRFSKRRGGRLVPLNNLLPFTDGGKAPKTPAKGDVSTDMTREFLMDLEILGDEGTVFNPGKAQAVFDFFPVTNVEGNEDILRNARDIDREAFEKVRTTNQAAPFYNQNRSRAKNTYLDIIDTQANNRFQQLMRDASRPENFSRNLLLDEDSPYYNSERAEELRDLRSILPEELRQEPSEIQMAEANTGLRSGGKSGIHIKPQNRGKFTAYCGGSVTSDCIAKGKRSSSPAVRKRATFAANARKWKKGCGGKIKMT